MTANEFGEQAFRAAVGADQQQIQDLLVFRSLLATWNERMNLVGPSALESFWLRHAFDSAQLLPIAPDAVRWADIGAGAGFPGVILAILLKGRPGAAVHLIESMAKKCRFLQEVVDALSLPAVVHNARAEHTCIDGLEVVTARACAPMVRLLGFAEPLMRRGVTGIFLKGSHAPREIEEARARWRFEASVLPSQSGEGGNIVKVEKMSRV